MADRARVLDLLIIGGGINGTGIARDAAGRGLKVALFEQHDLGQYPSSLGSRLIHGQAPDLEPRRARWRREALQERDRLLRIAPHIITPLEFWVPLATDPGSSRRFYAQHLGRAGAKAISPSNQAENAGLKPAYRGGFGYTDCWVEDSRLTVLNAMDAAACGARIYPRSKITSVRPDDGLWKVETAQQTFHARAIVNAAGAAAAEILSAILGGNSASPAPYLKGGHIITKKLVAGTDAFALRTADERVIFVIPYERDFSLIGSAETAFAGEPAQAEMADADTQYLCDAVTTHFKTPLTPAEVIWTYCGVRPHVGDDAPDHVLDLIQDSASPPLLSVYGGKIMAYRKLAEAALEKLLPAMGRATGTSWTASAPLPGGDTDDIATFARMFRAFNTHLDGATARRLAYSYGTRVREFVQPNMGDDFGAGLTRAEVDYLVRHEWARTAEDILWRRSKLGLHVPADTEERLAAYLARDKYKGPIKKT